MGVGCQWNTDWPAYDEKTRAAMGLQPSEKVAGILYFGTPTEEVTDRPRPLPRSLLTRWTGPL
jgi:hypothetical protein